MYAPIISTDPCFWKPQQPNCTRGANQATVLVEKLEIASDETLTIVVEPRHHLMGIAWPATAWHMTKDTCTREAVSIRYTASISCAQSLTYKSQGKNTDSSSFCQTRFPSSSLVGMNQRCRTLTTLLIFSTDCQVQPKIMWDMMIMHHLPSTYSKTLWLFISQFSQWKHKCIQKMGFP